MTSTIADDKLRVSVIGAQTAAPETPTPFTVYRTVVTYGGECYERLLRYSEFRGFYKKLKVRSATKFPAKTWSRKSSLEEELVEARQVMLNEFMKDVSKKELTPGSEEQLMKLLKIGKFEDGSRRVSELSTSKPSFIKSDRGSKLDTVVENKGDEAQGDRRQSSVALDRAATLTAMSVAFPAVTSNATTVLMEDERSEIGSQSWAPNSDDSEASSFSEANARPTTKPPTAPTRAAPHKSQSITSGSVLQRPVLKSSQSLPGQRSNHVEFSEELPFVATPASVPAPNTSIPEADCDPASPEKKYRDRINTHLSTINRLLSESEAETELESLSSRSFQTMAMPA